MSLIQFLQSCDADVIQQSPIQIVTETALNQYLYLDPSELEPIWIEPDQINVPQQVSQIQTRTLTPLSVSIYNGGTAVTIDYNFLSSRKSDILRRVGAWLGAGCFYLAQLNRIQSTHITTVQPIDHSLQNLYFQNPDSVLVLANPGSLSKLRNGILNQRISPQISGKLHTNNIIDFTHPVFSPQTRNTEIFIFNSTDSFVLASPTFAVRQNRLVFDFKMDIQNVNSVVMFSI